VCTVTECQIRKEVKAVDCVTVDMACLHVYPGLPSDILSTVRPELLSVNAENTSENNCDSKELESTEGSLDVDADAPLSNDDGVLVADEERRSGVVRFSIYWSYWTAVGRCLASLVLLSILLMQGWLVCCFR